MSLRRARASARASVRRAPRGSSACRCARAALLAPQVEARVAEVRRWPAGRRCPLGRLREAWVAHRYGLARAVDTGGALAGAVSARPHRRASVERSRSTRRSQTTGLLAGRRAARRRSASSPLNSAPTCLPATSLAFCFSPKACARWRSSTIAAVWCEHGPEPPREHAAGKERRSRSEPSPGPGGSRAPRRAVQRWLPHCLGSGRVRFITFDCLIDREVCLLCALRTRVHGVP